MGNLPVAAVVVVLVLLLLLVVVADKPACRSPVALSLARTVQANAATPFLLA